MAKKKPDISKVIKRVAREQRLEAEREVGRVRAKSWGGKDSPQKERKKWKNNPADD